MRTKIVAGNWKMNKTPSEATPLIEDIRKATNDGDCGVEVVVCVPFTAIPAAAKDLEGAKIGIGGFFPVVANAFIIPLIIVFLCGDLSATELLGWGESTVTFAYWANCISLLITEAVWVYALGTPVYLFVLRMRKRGVRVFLDGKKKPLNVSAEAKQI